MADNAASLARLNPPGIDLNFGCPAKVVNRHGGGAALLDEPELVAKIVAAVRRAVPSNIPVSAKMRLGFNDDSRAEECAIAIAQSGANELVVHARTKADGYRPPAYWSRIADICAVVDIKVIANGEIWNIDDAKRCQELSGCDTLMIGRGMVQNPGLANQIKNEKQGLVSNADWQSVQPLLHDFWEIVCNRLDRKSRTGRFKQWLNFLRRQYPEAEIAYMALRITNDPDDVDAWLAAMSLKTALQTHQ
jgi:tRNA-dihydrouridine synthase C